VISVLKWFSVSVEKTCFSRMKPSRRKESTSLADKA